MPFLQNKDSSHDPWTMFRFACMACGNFGFLYLCAVAPSYSINSYVSDDATAIAIAKAVLRPLIDRKLVGGQTTSFFYGSLEAQPVSNIWYVENASPNRLQWATPIIWVDRNKKTGQILKVADECLPYFLPRQFS